MSKICSNPVLSTHTMSTHGREHIERRNSYDDTILKPHVSSFEAAMASQSEKVAPLQSKAHRSEESLSGRTICENEQSLEREPSAQAAVEDGILQTPKRSCTASAVAHNGSIRPITTLSTATQDPARAEFPKLHKLSILATSTFILACVTVPCCVAFIGFLWSNPNGIQSHGTWLKIVLSGWILKSITISTMVLRVAVSAQAG